MAIYHFSVKFVSRAKGSSAVGAAAYRAAQRLTDERYGVDRDFRGKVGVVYSEVILPEGAAHGLADRATLWNLVEAREVRKDARLARDVEFAIPREMTEPQGVALARDFVAREFVAKGMIADLNVHWDEASDGSAKPHAHVMLSTRKLSADGFGLKVSEWNKIQLLREWRRKWADYANVHMAELGIDARIDHRRLADQGILLEPQNKIGAAGSRRKMRGEPSERADNHARIARENGNKLIADPTIALNAITHSRTTFTERDLAQFAFRHSDGKDQFDSVMAGVLGSPAIVTLGKDRHGHERFTSRAMIVVEKQLDLSALTLVNRHGHPVADQHLHAALQSAADRGLVLSDEQRDGLDHVTHARDFASIIGGEGSGKSSMLAVARDAWERQGYRVRWTSPSEIAAAKFEVDSGISSSTVASPGSQWQRNHELLGECDLLIVDEAGLAGTRQIERLLSAARAAGAKIVLVGDPGQPYAIDAGAAFRWLTQAHGAVEITQAHRQSEVWQRCATRALASGRTGEAIHAYGEHAMVRAASTRAAAHRALVDDWDHARISFAHQNRIILGHTNVGVRDLNMAARSRLRESGDLGADIEVNLERGKRTFADGDRIVFLRNERGMKITNGMLGTITAVSTGHMAVRTDDGHSVAFEFHHYAHVDHGYAAPFHKAQGVTVDEVYILATVDMDRHSTYVGLTRHRDRALIYFGRDDFATHDALTRSLSREPMRGTPSDDRVDDAAVRTFAQRRELRGGNVARDLGGKARGRLADPDVIPLLHRGRDETRGFAPSATPGNTRGSGPETRKGARLDVAAIRLRARVAELGLQAGRGDEQDRQRVEDRDREELGR